MKEDIKSIERLLKEAGTILKDRNETIAKGAGFNVFRLCGVNHYEIWHSKILAEFFNPQGSHGQGARFLTCFQKLLEDNYGFNGVFSNKTIVQTEVTGYTDDDSVGRMDILIEDKSEKSVCIIENKLFAGEQPEQLDRYAAWLKNERKGWKSILVFLTLNGREAWSSKDPGQYARLAYVSQDDQLDLESWIDSCVETISGQGKISVQSALEQYKGLIICLAKGEQAMSEAIVEKLKGRMECAKLIFDNYEAAKKNIEEMFFNEINEEMHKLEWVIDDWPALKTSSSNGERGWRWRLKDAKRKKREIWISVFIGLPNETGICDVGIFGKDFKSETTKRSFYKWCVKNKLHLERLGWYVADDQSDPYPLCQSVSDGEGSSFLWDAKFYDRITDGKDFQYRERVKKSIIDNLYELHTIMESFIRDAE
jgi:hypothetical protein